MITDTLRHLVTAGIYTMQNGSGAYNQIRVKEGHAHKVHFPMGYGLLELTVLRVEAINEAVDCQ